MVSGKRCTLYGTRAHGASLDPGDVEHAPKGGKRRGKGRYGECFGYRMRGRSTLSTLSTGEKRMVVGMKTNRRLFSRLAAMGILPGIELNVVSANDISLVVAVQGGRVTLSREIADTILVA